MRKEVIFVGWINKGKPADCGETMKNQLCIQKLEEFGINCMQMDFKNWRKHPWVFIQLVANMITHKDAALVLSTSPQNVYPLIKALKKIGCVAAVAAVMTAIRVTPPTRTTTSTAPIAKSVPNARVAAFVATSIPSRTDGKG